MKTHIHVYKVTLKAEIEFDEDEFDSVKDAESTALKLAESGQLKFAESDCKFVALGFDISK